MRDLTAALWGARAHAERLGAELEDPRVGESRKAEIRAELREMLALCVEMLRLHEEGLESSGRD